jgi:predicted dehydrogenase
MTIYITILITMTKRREFIKKSVLGSAGIAIGGMGFTSKSYASIVGANERISVAVIGIRNQGSVHIDTWCNLKESQNVVLKTLCDADEQFFNSRSKIVQEKTGVKPLTEWDIRKVLDDKEIDAVSIVVPNHWHALATIWACQAGKHVYIEKPASHNIWEGRKMIEASRKYNVRVQVGFQSRSGINMQEALKFLHDGGIGEVYMARGLCYKLRDSYGVAKDSTPPATFHYDRWLGPAPYRPYNVKRSHYCWHWYWDTGNGDTGNQGPHQFDIARLGLSKYEHPVSVYSAGGIYGFNKDDSNPENRTPGTLVYGGVEAYGHDKTSQETPNIQSSIFKYEDGKMLEFETRDRYTNMESSSDITIGNIFYGTEGYLEIKDESARPWKAFRKREKDPFAGSNEDKDANKKEQDNIADHFSNFLDAIRSGKDDTLRCDIVEGFYSSALPHLANISYRMGRELKFMGDYEKFANDSEADTLLTRIYRKPYIVPEEV